jgi:hyperosmotically inducible protein
MNTNPLLTTKALMGTAGIIFAAGVPMSASEVDDKIEASARSSYNFKNYLKDDAIKVSSNQGVVTLTGTVAHDYHKSLAQETVASLPGVKRVDNQLTVTGNQPAEHSDAWITTKVKATLLFHKNVSGTGTEVNTSGGVVTLTGKADSKAQRELTSEYAKDVEGVKEVKNDLVVGSHPASTRNFSDKVDDASITAQVKTALLFHNSTRALATRVETKDGAVTLHGEARSGAERDLVTKVVEDIRGVKRVQNKMSVAKS